MNKLNTAIFIFDAVEVLDFAGPFEVFSRTRLVPGVESRRSDTSAPFNVFTVARSADLVSATGGLRVLPHFDFGGAPPSFYQGACQNGVVAAHVYVKGSAGFSSTYTTSSPSIQEPFNCTGGVVEVKRTGAGVYRVHFGGLDNGSQLIAVGNQSVTPLGAAVAGGELTFKLVADSVGGGTVYQVTLDDTAGSSGTA